MPFFCYSFPPTSVSLQCIYRSTVAVLSSSIFIWGKRWDLVLQNPRLSMSLFLSLSFWIASPTLERTLKFCRKMKVCTFPYNTISLKLNNLFFSALSFMFCCFVFREYDFLGIVFDFRLFFLCQLLARLFCVFYW